jgi:predicted nucleic acid-binding protein
VADTTYRKPYIESSVFIGLIKGETVVKINPDGTKRIQERGKIGKHLLGLAEQQVFPVVISSLTIAEVHKRKGSPKLNNEEDKDILAYFEQDFISVAPVGRDIGEKANQLCRKYGLSPNDAIHLACAKEAKCDVLLSWDDGLNDVKDPDIRTEEPIMWFPKAKPKQEEMFHESRKGEITPAEEAVAKASDTRGSGEGSPTDQAGEQTDKPISEAQPSSEGKKEGDKEADSVNAADES